MLFFFIIQIVHLLTNQSQRSTVQLHEPQGPLLLWGFFDSSSICWTFAEFSWSDCVFISVSDVCARVLKTPSPACDPTADWSGYSGGQTRQSSCSQSGWTRCFQAIVLLSRPLWRLLLLIFVAAICVRNRPLSAFVRSDSETNYQ